MSEDRSSILPMPGMALDDETDGGEEIPGALPAPLLGMRETLPETVYVFPLRRAVGFPGLVMPVLLESESSRQLVEKARESGEFLALVGSHGYLEVAVNQGNAAGELGMEKGWSLTVVKG